jgi:hypothetical protein
MVAIVQLVRISVCGTEGRGFEPHWPPKNQSGCESKSDHTRFVFSSILTLTLAFKVYKKIPLLNIIKSGILYVLNLSNTPFS